MKRITQEEFIRRAKEVHGDRYDYSKVVFKTTKEHVTIVCEEHGLFEMLPKNHMNGQGCRKCGYIQNGKDRSLGLKEFLRRSKEVHGDRYEYSKVEYTSSGEQVLIGCPVHGFQLQIAQHHMNGCGCQKCHFDNREILTTEQFIELAKAVHGDKFDYSKSVYGGNSESLTIICKTHGEFIQRANDHTSKKAGCPYCAGVKRLTTDEFIERAKLVHGDKYDYSKSEYALTDSKVVVVCPDHGEFLQTPHDHIGSKAGCPSCGCNGVSKAELELKEFVASLGFEVTTRNRTIIKPYELDIVVESEKIAFEYNGLYYHSEAFERNTNKHQQKTRMTAEAGYRLVHIYEDDWRDRRPVVEKTVKHLLGISEFKHFARKLTVVQKSHSEVKEFYEANHMQGSGKGDSWCLLDDGRVVAAMQFGQASSERGNADKTRWELVRYATLGNVVGGASRLFKAFLKDNPQVHSILSYSDNDMFTGEMYERLGFFSSGESRPDYKVIVKGKRVHKANFRRERIQKHYPKVYSEDLTEREMCLLLGYFRIYNSGITKWEWSRNLD